MSDPGWQQVKRIFSEALARPPEKRMAYLKQACPDASLRVEVESLLSFYDEDPEFLEASVDTEALRAVEAGEREEALGQMVGPYRLVREIGRGGMGTVYLGVREDGQFEQQVAIKLGKHDALNQEILERLRHERQVLASLDHPNIAKLFDGGVTREGRPYFAMEYIAEGRAIDAFCRQEGKSVKSRLVLFQQICDAVAYAHRKLVVHRDLKPSNILVSPSGIVKLLDFGVAKLLDDGPASQAPVTRTGLRIMTPEYASPEQVAGQGITTLSDIYTLGVILYELLAGQRPYEVHHLSPSQVEEQICAIDPPKPSTAIQSSAHSGEQEKKVTASNALSMTPRFYRQVQGDLDNIVMKALRKEPAQRYTSVEQFREDIDRYLNELPVLARPATVRYRVSKFLKRHRVGVLAMALVLLALIGGIVSTSYQAAVASSAREAAEQRAQDVRAMANTLLFDIHDAIRDLPGATPARRLLVRNAEQYLATLSEELPENPALQLELAEAYNRVGEIQGDPHFPNLGDLQGARTYYQDALHLRTLLYEADTSSLENARALALAEGRLAVLLSWGGDNEEAIAMSHQALERMARVYSKESEAARRESLHDLGRMQSELGWWYVFAGRMEEAKRQLATARRALETVATYKAGEVDFEIDLWRVYNYQVDAYRWSEAPDTALVILEDFACRRLDALNVRHAFNPRLQSCLRTCLNKLGDLYKIQNDLAGAIQQYEASLEIAQTMAAADSTNTLGIKGVAGLQGALGLVYQEAGNLDRARKYLEDALAVKRRLYVQDSTNGETGNTLGNTLRSLCHVHLLQSQHGKAVELCQEAVGIFQQAIASDSLNGIWRSNLVETYLVLGDVYRSHGQATAGTARSQSLQQSTYWLNEGIGLIERMEKDGGAFSWSAKLDSLRAIENRKPKTEPNAH